jgi:disulfide bond formation protein DsbB
MTTAQETVRAVRIMYGVLLLSILMYSAVGEMFGHRGEAGKMIRGSMIAVALMNAGIAQLYSRKMVKAAEATLAMNPSDEMALGRWRQGHLITFVLCESVALMGLAMRIVGAEFLEAAALYFVAFFLMLLWMPRAEFAGE